MFEEFAHARSPHLLRSAWLLCGDMHQAEDLVQETLAKVYVRWHRRLGPRIENPAAFAQTTLVRTFLSVRRHRSSSERPFAEVPDAEHPDASHATELRVLVTEALAGLTAQDRAVLVLRYLEDRSVREVAQLLAVSEGAVRTRSTRALGRLRSQLNIQLDPGPTTPVHGGTR